jgi:hypothetical protein
VIINEERTLEKVNGNTVTIATKSGKETNVPLKDGAPIIAVTKGAMSDIKDNTFVGITAMAATRRHCACVHSPLGEAG